MRSMDSKLRARFRRRLCYGSAADLETPSLPLTEAAVDFFQDSMPGADGLGRLDLSTASRFSGQNGVSPCSMVMSVLYAKRLKHRNTHYLQSMSSSDIFFISMMMASKYLYDEGVDEEVYNDEWAEVTGLEGKEVNQMEVDFLHAMDWGLFVRPEEFEETLADLERRLALKEGLKRGWFTYTELAVLLDGQLMYSLWNQVGTDCSKLVTALSMAYLASVVSMIGSAAIAVQLSGPLTTATMAVLSMQSSYLLRQSSSILPAVVSTKPSLHGAALSLSDAHTNGSWSATFDMPPLILPSQENVTEGEMDFSLSDDASLESPTLSETPAVNNEVLSTDIMENETDDPPVKLARSSVLSLWFFDSLLSQIWSVVERKPHPPEVSCGDCEQSSSALVNPSCCAKNGHLRKTCRCYQPSCVLKSGKRNCRIQSWKRSQRLDHKSCKARRCCLNTVDVLGKDVCCEAGKGSISSSQYLQTEKHNPLTPKVSNAKEILSVPSSDFHSSNDLVQTDRPSSERKNVAFLDLVLNQHGKLSSLLPTFNSCKENIIFSGLSGSLLVT